MRSAIANLFWYGGWSLMLYASWRIEPVLCCVVAGGCLWLHAILVAIPAEEP